MVTEVLRTAAAGAPGAVLVVGDPGTGKTRLVDDALDAAATAGLVSAVGRCSQDDGAPPLWPWYALLDGLGIERPAELDRAADDADIGPERAFAVQDALARAVRDRARDQPVLLVVEDLHWADTRTLRALAHLVTTLGPGDRVALVATRRARPQPTGALADLGAALARHGARTVELAGLGEHDAQTLVLSVAGTDADPTRVAEWRTRTGGNPFFLVELARLATTTPGWRGEVPESVQSVVTRRLEDLPDATREVLVVSAALGREHSPLLLAHVGGWAPDEVSDRLEPAHEVGIVHQRDDGRLVFEHALTRDAVVAAVSPGRLARVHARIAHALESVPRGSLAPAERAFDLAHHWLAAGPVHAPQAWRAASVAAARRGATSPTSRPPSSTARPSTRTRSTRPAPARSATSCCCPSPRPPRGRPAGVRWSRRSSRRWRWPGPRTTPSGSRARRSSSPGSRCGCPRSTRRSTRTSSTTCAPCCEGWTTTTPGCAAC